MAKKDSRKNRASRASRKNRKDRKDRKNRASRKSRKCYRRNMAGGAESLPMAQSLAQGREYAEIHKAQHGGASWTGAGVGAPIGYQGLLPDNLRTEARIAPLDQQLSEIKGMSDHPQVVAQAGGKRKSRKGSRKARKDRKNRKTERKVSRKDRKDRKTERKVSRKDRKNRKMRGGAVFSPASVNAPGMLLSPSQAAKAGTADFSNPLLLK